MPALKPSPDDSRLRTLQIGSRLLSYRLKRSARRTIGFVINRSGLTVTAPNRLSLAYVEGAIAEKSHWIFTKLEEWLVRADTAETLPTSWTDGALISLCGEPQTLRLVTSRGSRAHLSYDKANCTATLALPENTATSRIALQLRHWLQAEAKQLFSQRLAAFAPIVGVQYKAFALSSARTRWGSCSSTGHIRLNWRLIHCPLEWIDYVVVHELAHLLEMNHSPRFWAEVERVLPSYRQARQALKNPPPGLMPDL